MTTDNTQSKLDEALIDLALEVDAAASGYQKNRSKSKSIADLYSDGISEAKQAIVEWHEIEKSEVYNSGCIDTAKHILALFDNQIPEQLKRWLRLEIEDRGKL